MYPYKPHLLPTSWCLARKSISNTPQPRSPGGNIKTQKTGNFPGKRRKSSRKRTILSDRKISTKNGRFLVLKYLPGIQSQCATIEIHIYSWQQDFEMSNFSNLTFQQIIKFKLFYFKETRIVKTSFKMAVRGC